MRIERRRHANGWASIIEERADGGDLLMPSVEAPDGVSHHPPPLVRRERTRPWVETRRDLARLTADRLIAIVTGHLRCDAACEPWH